MHWNEFSLHFFEYAHEYNETLIASLNSGLLHQMVLKLALSSSPENPERQEEPDLIFVIFPPQMYFWAQFFST